MPQPQYKKQNRAKKRVIPGAREKYGSAGLVYCVYLGNYPQVVRDALALRVDQDRQPIWKEVVPKTENIGGMDLVWKPVNFLRSHGFGLMGKRCWEKPERPFAYSHYENIHALSTKPGLIRTLGDYYSRTPMFKQAGYTLQHSMAMSYVIPGGDCLGSRELNDLKKLFKRIAKRDMAGESLPARQLEKNYWILKPENENRGRGIELASTLQDILLHLHKKAGGETVVVQKYIERPLLYHGRKFDIRALALIDDAKNLWQYRPCYLRTSSEPYTLQDTSKYVHLTNNCYQANSETYQAHEPANQVPYDAFLEYLDTHGQVSDLDKGHLMQRMKDLMIDCHAAACPILDPRKRPGFNFELVGFDFILDEDLRVWLIEVNTCPYLGSVLPAEQPSFMLDLMDDTLKLTVDKCFFSKTATPEELASQTEYELLWSADGKVNQRTVLRVEPEPVALASGLGPTKSGKEESKVQPPGKLGWFPQCLYPSREIHGQLLRAQANAHDRRVRQKHEEQLLFQKAMKARAARLAGGPSSYGLLAAYGLPNSQAAATIEGRSLTHKRAPEPNKFAAPKQSGERGGAGRAGDVAAGGAISRAKRTLPASVGQSKGAATKANGSTPAAGALVAAGSKRTRSALGLPPRPGKEAADGNGMANHGSAAQIESTPDATHTQNDQSAAATGYKGARKPQPPLLAAAPYGLVELVSQALNAAAAGGVSRKGNTQAARGQAGGKSEQPRKQFEKLFALILASLEHAEPTMQAQGLQALVAVASSHFVLYMQQQSHVLGLLALCDPESVAQEAAQSGEGRPPLRARAKVAECLAEMCRAQAHGFFRAAILGAEPVFGRVTEYLLDSLKQADAPVASLYSQLFLALCLGPESAAKAPSKARRSVYIPGETQEHKRIKRRALQSGALLTAHLVQIQRPELREQLQSLYHSLDDGDVLMHLMCLLDFVCAGPQTEMEENGTRTSYKVTDDQSSGLETKDETQPHEVNKLTQQQMLLQKYAKENVLPVPAFRALKAEADRLVPSGANTPSGPPGKFSHCFPEALQTEFLALCESQSAPDGSTSFGITYLQEQLGLAVAVTEKRLKGRSLKAASLGERSTAHARLQDFREVLPVEPMAEIEGGAFTVGAQSPARVLDPSGHAVKSNGQAYRGTLISQLKKGLLLETEQPDLADPVESSKKARGGEAEEYSFAVAPHKQLHRGASRPHAVPWRSAAQARFGVGPANSETRGQGQGPNKGAAYHSQKRGAGGRASLGLDDLVRTVPHKMAGGPEGSKANAGRLKKAEAALRSPGRNPRDQESLGEGQSGVQRQITPGSKGALPPFISTVHEPQSLVYAPLLSQPALAKAQIAQALEAVNEAGDAAASSSADRGARSPVLLPEVNCQTRRSVNVREQEPKILSDSNKPIHKHAGSGGKDPTSTVVKRPGKQSKFRDDYERVTGQGGLMKEAYQNTSHTKGRKGNDRLHEEYRRALRAMGDLQTGLDRNPASTNAGPYVCANLQPYLASIGAALVPNLKDRAALAGPYTVPDSRVKHSKGPKGLHTTASTLSLGRASHKNSAQVPADDLAQNQ